MSCFFSGACPDCGDCLDCYGGEYCAISGNYHGDYLPDDEPVANEESEGVEGTPD